MILRSYVKHLEALDNEAFESNHAFIGPDLLIDEIFNLHDQLSEIYQQAARKLSRDQREALSDCLQALRREFLFANLACLRAHSTDSQNHRRKAVEFCAFGIRMVDEPHAACIWLEATKSKTKYGKYKSYFKVIPFIKNASECGIELDKLYDELCREVHATAFAIKTQTRIIVDEKGKRINWLDYHDDSSPAERYLLAQRFLTGIYLDFGMLLAFAHAIYKKFPDIDPVQWKERAAEFFDLYNSESDRIKQLSS